MSYDENLPPNLAYDSHFNNEREEDCPDCKGEKGNKDCEICNGEGKIITN